MDMFEVRVYSGDEGWSEIMRSEAFHTQDEAEEKMRGIPEGHGYYLVVQEATAPPLPVWLAQIGGTPLFADLGLEAQRKLREQEEYVALANR